MEIRVKLNDMQYRYDVYHMINIFYSFWNIEFVDENWDFSVEIAKNTVSIFDKDGCKKYTLDISLAIKEGVKMSVFQYLTEKTNKIMPWGTLIGIRPSKIALSLLNKGKDDDYIVNYFHTHFQAREDKAKLCIEIAKMEKRFVNKDQDTVSIYVGMPFCPTRCLYCSFTSNPIEGCKNLVEPYLECLYKEIEITAKYIKDNKLKVECVYFGGGTPTSIDDEQFEKTMMYIYNNFVRGNNVNEFTVECGRPDSITYKKLQSMKKYEVQRISINPQTMNDDTLKLIGRRHSVNDVVDKFNMARDYGLDNINMDIIVGLPGENVDHIKKTCDEILKLNPDSVTVHGMSVKRGSRLHENLVNKEELYVPEQNELNLMYERTMNLANRMNMKPYYMYRQKNMVGNMENIGYTIEGKEGIYNIQMIEERQTIISCGADAITKVVFLDQDRIERHSNVKDVREYINRIQEMIEKKLKLLDTLYK